MFIFSVKYVTIVLVTLLLVGVLMLSNLSKINIITGHYGCGKTNFAVNLAVMLANMGEKVTVVDLDIVNPYFRTADFTEIFDNANIALMKPQFANTNLDIPSINFDLASLLKQDGKVIIDVGGDDAGGVALGRYQDILATTDNVTMFYLFNKYRYLTQDSDDALELMHEIEAAAKIKADALINTSNLGEETTADDIRATFKSMDEISQKTGLGIAFTVAKKDIANELSGEVENLLPVEIYVKQIWS